VPPPGTVDELFEAAIALEEQAKALYLELARRFAHAEEVAAYWRSLAEEEITHASWLAAQKAKLTPEVLARPADPAMLRRARWRIEIAIDDDAAQVRNLDDAYELAHEVESGETNAILSFLIDEYESGPEARAFLRAQLGEHIARLSEAWLPPRYASRASRQALRAL
jgi:hypothetical protein